VSGSKRSAALPDVATSLELGFPASDYNFWLGLFAPADTPPELVERLNRAVTVVLSRPAAERLRALAIDPAEMSREEFAEYVRKDGISSASLTKKTSSDASASPN
jgi:tripartite-type tricarboxylate transporter receptor subunit TctC